MTMSRLHFTTREIGSVRVFDLMGEATNQDAVQEVAWKIQRNIRRHRLQRVILNVQKIKFLDELSIRKLVAAFLRPQRSAIYGATGTLSHQFEETYLPQNIKLCPTEKEVAEDFGPFLFHKEVIGKVLGEEDRRVGERPIGRELERRRSKRMHVAIPLEMTVSPRGGESIETKGIATNISEGGVFIEYLDLDALDRIEALDPIEGISVEIRIRPSGNFPEEYELAGVIRRKEVRKRGLGLAVQFTPGANFPV
jgi:hypothetical protein